MHEMLKDLRHDSYVVTGEVKKKPRKAATRLDEHEKWEIAKYMIESKLVMLDKEGRFTRFRIFEKDIIEEINLLEITPKKLSSGYHLKDSLDFYHTCCALTNNLPNVPIQDSVQEDMLKIELQKAMTERDQLRDTVDRMNYLFAKAISDMEKNCDAMESAYRSSHDNAKTTGPIRK